MMHELHHESESGRWCGAVCETDHLPRVRSFHPVARPFFRLVGKLLLDSLPVAVARGLSGETVEGNWLPARRRGTGGRPAFKGRRHRLPERPRPINHRQHGSFPHSKGGSGAGSVLPTAPEAPSGRNGGWGWRGGTARPLLWGLDRSAGRSGGADPSHRLRAGVGCGSRRWEFGCCADSRGAEGGVPADAGRGRARRR